MRHPGSKRSTGGVTGWRPVPGINAEDERGLGSSVVPRSERAVMVGVPGYPHKCRSCPSTAVQADFPVQRFPDTYFSFVWQRI